MTAKQKKREWILWAVINGKEINYIDSVGSKSSMKDRVKWMRGEVRKVKVTEL